MEPDVLERILDGREKPRNIQLALLRNITSHFSEEQEIGQGGFATVYKGVLANGNVAVKKIRNTHTIDDKLFYREVDSLLAISHQNIVRFLGFCASTDQTAVQVEGSRNHVYAEIRERLLCFEYISNGSLESRITDELRGLEWDTRYHIIKGICEGLQYLHMEKHIYHMDLKPANILLDDDMVPKITDFGLSRLDEKSQTMSVNRYGSLGYCAPEYIRHGKMSAKSDIYSLGTIIIELVTGDKGIPYNNKNNEAYMPYICMNGCTCVGLKRRDELLRRLETYRKPKVLRRWRHRWKKTGKETPLRYQQVNKCIDIGLLCQESDPCKRPFIWEINQMLMEDTNGQVSSADESTVGQISPLSEDDMLGIEPLELHFPFELNKQMSCTLQLTNDTGSYIAFNVQEMSPLLYCTQPNKGVLPPRSKCSVDITLPQDKAPRYMQRTNEFIVRSTKVNDGFAVEDITVNMINEETDNMVDEVNLDVIFYPQLQKVLQSHSGQLLSNQLSDELQESCSLYESGNHGSAIRDIPTPVPTPEGGSDDVEVAALAYFQQLFSGQISVDAMIQILTRLKESLDKREQDMFNCMISNLFEEYMFFTKYPDKQLKIAAVLFGSIIKHQLVALLGLGIALRAVLDALRKPVGSKMFMFGTTALEQFLDRLVWWPQYCKDILRISHLRGTHPEIVYAVALAMIKSSENDPGIDTILSTVRLASGSSSDEPWT